MDSVLRAALVYAVLLVLFRLTGKRSIAQITTFDVVLLLIISEAVQPMLIGEDQSMTNGLLVVLTLLTADIALSVVNIRSRRLDRLLNDVPLMLIADGQVLDDRMKAERVSEDDILEQARIKWGIVSLDQVRHAVLERSGEISIIPAGLPWVAAAPSSARPTAT